MDLDRLVRKSDVEWWIEPHGAMRVPGVLYASEALVREMDEKVYEQVSNVATLPGIVRASYAMPDAHWGYGFPIGGVAAFDAERGGVISAGGVGFDISCGVRTLTTGLRAADLGDRQRALADALARAVPAGVGSVGRISLDADEASEGKSLGSSCHGAGRRMSRHEAVKRFRGRQVVDDLARRGILVRSPSSRGVAEEAPGAYKDVTAVVEAADRAGLSRVVARLEPIVCIKG